MSVLASRRPPAAGVHDEASLSRFVTELEVVLHELSVKMALVWWERYTGGSGEGLDELERARSEILLDPAYDDLVRNWSEERLSGPEGSAVSDPLLARRLAILGDLISEARVSGVPEIYTLQNDILQRVIAFRPVVRGGEIANSERIRILRHEPDRAWRREAWMSIAPLSMELAKPTVELIRRRNHLAREAGAAGFVELTLALASLTPAEVMETIERLEAASAPLWASFLERSAAAEGLDAVEPWDVTYLVEKDAAIPSSVFPSERIEPSLEAFVRAFGQDPVAIGIKIVRQDIPFGGLCVPIDPPTDVRILANPRDGHGSFSTLFHEYGHGLHAVFAGGNSRLLQEEPGVLAEGLAEVWGWFTFYPGWLRSLGLDEELAATVVRAQGLRLAARHRTLSADVVWELGAYQDPYQDLTALAAATESRFTLAAARPVHRWAGGPFPSGYPMYKQNYILADLIAAATHRTLAEDHGPDVLGNARVWEAVSAAYWRPGASIPWRERLRRFTGRDLDAAAIDYGAPLGPR